MRRILYLIVIIAGISLLASTKTPLPIDKKIWIKIDSLEAEGLYRSALGLADQVYLQARKELDTENEIRALIYRVKYIQELEEDGQLAAISAIEKELPDERLVPGALKHTILAELYYRYYTANRWQINQNPPENAGAGQPVRNWPPERFFRVILDQYELSVRNSEHLGDVRVGSLPGLWVGNLADTVNKPFLYDVLISRGLDFLQNIREFSLPVLKPAVYCSPDLFREPSGFIQLNTHTGETGDNPYLKALHWYSDWLAAAVGNSQVGIDLKRLEFVHEQSCNAQRDSLFEAGLIRWAGRVSGDSVAANVYEALANYHIERSALCRINDADSNKFKNERKLASGWLEKAEEWSETLAGKRCRNLMFGLLKPELSVQSESYQIPGENFPVSVEYRNLAWVHYRIVRMNALDYYARWNDLETPQKLEQINNLPVVQSGPVHLPDDGLMNQHRANMLIKPLPAGFYVMVFSNVEGTLTSNDLVVITPVATTGTMLVSSPSAEAGRDFYFLDRQQGASLEGLKVIPWYSLYDRNSRRSILEKGSEMTTGEEGFLSIANIGPGRDDPSPKAYRLEIINKTDTLVTRELFYPGSDQGRRTARTAMMLYTDRSIYKPGDETFFRGILIDYIGDSLAIHKADSVVLMLQDSRYQMVTQLSLPVDSLGVFTGSLKLPFRGLTGTYLIQSRYGQASIRMEQYRRPAYRINIERGNGIFLKGDSVRVSGTVTALSGEPVSGAEITADVDLQPFYRVGRWSPFSGQKIRIATIKGKTNALGKYTCSWKSIPEGASPFGNGMIDRYTITVVVTDLNGESHQEMTSVDCGPESTGLVLMLPGKVTCQDTLLGKFGAFSTDGRILKVPVTLKISKLADPDRTWIEPLLPEPDRFIVNPAEWEARVPGLPYKNENQPSSWALAGTRFEQLYANDTTTPIKISSGLTGKGWYRVDLIPVDPLACKSVTRYLFVDDPRLARVDPLTVMYGETSASEVKSGELLELRLASYEKGRVLVELVKSGGQKEQQWHQTGRKKKILRWEASSEWQGGVSVHLIMVRSNRVYEKNIPVAVPWENSVLRLSGLENLTSVQPGDSVDIALSVRNESGQPVRASVGITVYDASLDLIAPHTWSPVRRSVFGGGTLFKPLISGLSGYYTLVEPSVPWVNVVGVEPIGLNWFGLGFYGISRMDSPMMKMAMSQPEGAAGRGEPAAGNEADSQTSGENAEMPEVAAESGDGGIVIRKDFRETALFAGNILTDEKGMAKIRFRVPEVFTEWKVLANAHDSHLAVGNLEHHFKSARDLMLKPNFPEFMRRGDTIELAARLGWYGKGNLKTVTTLDLRDTLGRTIISFPGISSSISSGGSEPFYWHFPAENSEPVTYRILSASDGNSDGMEDTIQVYPDDVSLWNAQPFFFAKNGMKKLKLDQAPVEAAFEVTTTPVWQILRSLPEVVSHERDCSEYWFSRLYLACLTGSIADRFPEVAARYLSDSVPDNQKERYQQVRGWMDRDSRAVELAYVLEKLSDLQNPDGTWPWYKGMGTDLFMTQQIIAGFGELKAWGVFDVTLTQRGKNMLNDAIEAMDLWLYRQFRELVRTDTANTRKIQLDPLVVHYLYARSFFSGLMMSPANEIAWMHFTERIPLEWTSHSPGLQALMAIASVQTGHMPDALPIYKSLRERSKLDPEWGIFWPRKGYGSSWFEWDLWMQSRMIELFSCIEDGQKDLDQLKLYLIHQKRGRDWGNGLVAAWASKSLLFYGTEASITPASVGMTWGSEKYSPLRVKTGSTGVSGYYRFEWKNPDEMPEARTMEVTKTDGGPAWGTLYTLNNYSLDQLSATSGPLTIRREVMVRDTNGSWASIPQGKFITVGEVLRIRLTLNSDRELSYIEVRDNLGTGFMPRQVLSGYRYHTGLSYYQSREPDALVFNISQLRKGLSALEYEVVAEQAGSYSGGYATVTSLYAPEFRGWSDSFRIRAKR